MPLHHIILQEIALLTEELESLRHLHSTAHMQYDEKNELIKEIDRLKMVSLCSLSFLFLIVRWKAHIYTYIYMIYERMVSGMCRMLMSTKGNQA